LSTSGSRKFATNVVVRTYLLDFAVFLAAFFFGAFFFGTARFLDLARDFFLGLTISSSSSSSSSSRC